MLAAITVKEDKPGKYHPFRKSCKLTPECTGGLRPVAITDRRYDELRFTRYRRSDRVDPKLGYLIGVRRNSIHPLLPGSPAINAGDPAAVKTQWSILATDQRGAARVGAVYRSYEYTSPDRA